MRYCAAGVNTGRRGQISEGLPERITRNGRPFGLINLAVCGTGEALAHTDIREAVGLGPLIVVDPGLPANQQPLANVPQKLTAETSRFPVKLRVWAAPSYSSGIIAHDRCVSLPAVHGRFCVPAGAGPYLRSVPVPNQISQRHSRRNAPGGGARAFRAINWCSSDISRSWASTRACRASTRAVGSSGAVPFRPGAASSTSTCHLLPTLLPLSNPLAKRRLTVFGLISKASAAACMSKSMPSTVLQVVNQPGQVGYTRLTVFGGVPA